MIIIFQLYHALKFDSTVVIYVLTTNFVLISKLKVHEYTSGLTSTRKAELFCSCKCCKFIGQNKVKIFKS